MADAEPECFSLYALDIFHHTNRCQNSELYYKACVRHPYFHRLQVGKSYRGEVPEGNDDCEVISIDLTTHQFLRKRQFPYCEKIQNDYM